MAVRFDWDRLETYTAEAIRTSLNDRLRSLISTEDGPLRDILKELEVTTLAFGEIPPFVELLAITPAIAFSAPSVPAEGLGASTSQHFHPGQGLTSPNRQRPSRAGTVASNDRSEEYLESEAGFPPRQSSSHLELAALHQNSSTFAGSAALGQSTVSPVDSHATVSLTDEGGDFFAEYLGSSGLFLKFHVTYGGDLMFTVKAIWKKEIVLSPSCAVKMELPLRFSVGGVRFDLNINVNCHRSACQVWIDDNGPASQPLTKLGVVTMIGSERGQRTRNGGAPPCRDDGELAGLILAELQAVLHHRLVAPHYHEIIVKQEVASS